MSSRYTVRRIASAIGRRLGLIETPAAAAPSTDPVYDPAPTTDPLGFEYRCAGGVPAVEQRLTVPMCEGSFDSRTAIVTMNKSLRAAKTLELTVRSILNERQFEPLITELLTHLTATGSDDTYQQVYAGSRDYLAAQLQQPIDAGRKFLLIAALKRVHAHFVQAADSEFAYDPATKPNANAVYYPNPKYGKSLYDELPFVRNLPLVNSHTRVLTAGLAPAAEIIAGLKQKNVPVSTALTGETISTSVFMRQLIDLAFGIKSYPSFVDPLRPRVRYADETAYKSATESFVASLRAELQKIDICLLILSENEAWRLNVDNTVLPGVPADLPPYLVHHQTLTVKENLDELQRMFNTWRSFNPALQLLVGISPLPLRATAVTGQHVITANALGKSTLRVAIDQFTRSHAGVVHYFPIYEAAMYATANPVDHEGLTLSASAGEKAISLFSAMFVDPSVQAAELSSIPQTVGAPA